MTVYYLAVGLAAIAIYGRVLWRRWHRFRLHRDQRSRRELVVGIAYAVVAIGLLVTTIAGQVGWPANLRLVLGAMTVGAFVAAGFEFDQEDKNDGAS